MAEEKYTEEDKEFIMEQCRIMNGKLDEIYDNIFKVITTFDKEDMIEVMKRISEMQKK